MAGLTADAAVVDALHHALDADPTAGSRPGQLRAELTARLGELAPSHRPQIHQVVAAAEDNLPATLTRVAPLTSQSLLRLSEELATGRGWTRATAERTIAIWATALGFGDLVASSWPREPLAVTVLPGDPPATPPSTEPLR
ncbi:hypothetical protein SAMN04487968_106230 [Nocardioides terrae]|uniref:Uncharacterized protein n=1 Tax=Nocardioides terrae TaxID=574651 RepID=A0A1I1JHP4_9ACTN|nr:hypothetical protein [Nocardioides terrae]SFC44970.1 hypothetical protein SAMN04487968_106230 [Nocardioides terrae]